MPDINYQAELAVALLTQIQLERQLKTAIEESVSYRRKINQLTDDSEIYEDRIRAKDQVIEHLHRENEGLKRSEATYRNMVRQYRERAKLIHDLSKAIGDEQVSEASGESNLTAYHGPIPPRGGEIRHDREAKAACDSEDARTASQFQDRQGSPLDYLVCSRCGNQITPHY